MGNAALWCDHCGWGSHKTLEHNTHAPPPGFSRWPCENCGHVGHDYEHCRAPRDWQRIVRQFEINAEKRAKRQRSTIELGRAITQLGKSTDILPPFMQKHLQGVNLSAAGGTQAQTAQPPGDTGTGHVQQAVPSPSSLLSQWQFLWGPLPDLASGNTDAFIAERVTPLKDLVKWERLDQEPVRARLVFASQPAAVAARSMLMSMQSMINDTYVPTQCTAVAELRMSGAPTSPRPRTQPTEKNGRPQTPVDQQPTTAENDATNMNLDSPGRLRGTTYFNPAQRSNALKELEQEQERQKGRFTNLETKVGENTKAIQAVRGDVHSLVQQQNVHRLMDGVDWHVPGRVDHKAKPLLRGWVRKPTVGDHYFVVEPSAAGDKYEVQHATIVEVHGRTISWAHKGEDPDEALIMVCEPDWVYQDSNKANAIAESLTETLRRQIDTVTSITAQPCQATTATPQTGDTATPATAAATPNPATAAATAAQPAPKS